MSEHDHVGVGYRNDIDFAVLFFHLIIDRQLTS